MLRAAGFVILFLGLALAVRINQSASQVQVEQAAVDQEMLAEAPLAPADSKRYGYEVGQLSGETGLLVDRAFRAADWLLHGRPLAVLIAVASFTAAGALLIAADRAAGKSGA